MANRYKNIKVQEDEDEEGENVPVVVVEELTSLRDNKETPLRKTAEKFKFPLSSEDIKDLAKLALRFDSMDNAVGLSLPQLGINKRAFIFEVKRPKPAEEQGTRPNDQKRGPTADEMENENPFLDIDLQKVLEKKDPNVIFPKTLWVNPTYQIPRDAKLDEDYEVCYSLKCQDELVVSPVFRFDRINYRAYDTQGRIYEGQAEGYAARVIQHELDHLDGKLYIDYVQPERVMPLPVYADKVEKGQVIELQKGIVPEFPDS